MGDKAAKPQNYSGKFTVAKAGRRKLPAAKSGKHLTNPHDRKRARFLNNLGVKFYIRPDAWLDHSLKQTS